MLFVKVRFSRGWLPSVMMRVGGVVVKDASKAGFCTTVRETVSGTGMPWTVLPAIPGFWASRR